jgi:DNA-binding transcriptional ArsR family regulator
MSGEITMDKCSAGNDFLIKDRETLKLFADPLHVQILETLETGPLTVKQVAACLGLAPGKLYYHFTILEKAGLIHVAETRQVANLLEKTYQSAASHFDIAPDLLTTRTKEGRDSVYDLITSTLDATRQDLLRSLHARQQAVEGGARESPRSVVINRVIYNIPDGRAEEFAGRVRGLCEEFGAFEVPPGTPGSMYYGLAMAFYPNFFYEESREND